MKGLFIPEITAEMFRNGCLESIEALMAEGEIYDIEYSRWIPVTERLPEKDGEYFVTWTTSRANRPLLEICEYSCDEWDIGNGSAYSDAEVIAWMPLPVPYDDGVDG